jgi:uncharacterized membrane protein (DUF485 family)
MSTDIPPPVDPVGSHDEQPTEDRNLAAQSSTDFAELRKTFRAFVFPMTVAFLAWYLLYVLLSVFARDFMDTQVVGHLNIALVFGLLQFVSTFAIAVVYSRYARTKLDPLSDRIRDRLTAPGGSHHDGTESAKESAS